MFIHNMSARPVYIVIIIAYGIAENEMHLFAHMCPFNVVRAWLWNPKSPKSLSLRPMQLSGKRSQN